MAVSSPTNENTSTFKEPSKFIKKNRYKCLCIRREVKLLFTCVVTFFFCFQGMPKESKEQICIEIIISCPISESFEISTFNSGT